MRAGKLTEVRLVQPEKAELKALLPLTVASDLRSTEVRLVQPEKAEPRALLPLTVVRAGKLTEVRPEQ